MKNYVDVLLARAQEVETQLPLDIKQQLGDFTWRQRLHSIHQEDKKIRVHFFSDGLTLALKSNIEIL